MAAERFEVTLHRQSGYRFDADTDDGHRLAVDEPAPLGRGEGPNPARLLATAVGHCLSASLTFCLRRAQVELLDLTTTVSGEYSRNERGRLRIGRIRVKVAPRVADADRDRLARCLELFEDYCVVTESVRHGIPVDIEIEDSPATA
ncbi:MAG: OsmC family protein [Gemmatimonadales bacterium]